MSRHPGVRSVGYVEDPKSKERAEIKLETSSMEFYVRVGTQTHRSKDGDVVRKWAREELKRLRSVEWVPVIIVETEDDDPDTTRNYNGNLLELTTAGITIEARRTYLAKVGKSIQELTWAKYDIHRDPVERIERSAFAGMSHLVKDLSDLPVSDKFMPNHQSTTTYVIPYDDDTWKGIAAVCASVRRSRDALNEILKSKESAQFLALVGSGKVAIPTPEMPRMIGSKSSDIL